jgi:predicted nucleic acid-binding protein
MGAVFAALLDTNVLWPSLQRDFILSLAIEGLYRPLWSGAILEELHIHEQYKLLERGTEPSDALVRADFLIAQMRTAFDDALVTGWEGLDGTYGLPDPDDEHVLAAAVVGNAGAIVTDNLKDFPPAKVPSHINVITGREFAENTADVNPEAAVRALVAISTRHKLTPRTPRELLGLLVSRYAMNELGDILAGALDEAEA